MTEQRFKRGHRVWVAFEGVVYGPTGLPGDGVDGYRVDLGGFRAVVPARAVHNAEPLDDEDD